MILTIVQIPHNWKPRDYQLPAWGYLEHRGKHAELIWHRRAGKDEICMHHAAGQMVDRPATYWHMLPLANQVRKAIWEAVNPHTGKRRIKEAFPTELFTHRDTDMMVRSKFNESTWQCLGSDNYEAAIGSPPAGITYSEWALANPSVRGYLRPILAENNGYQVYITTPRGKNHAHNTFRAAQDDPNAFAELLTVDNTKALSPEQLDIERKEYISTYGEDVGVALFEQEYYCSFDAAILGAYYGAEFRHIDQWGRICDVPYNDDYPVEAVFDIGRTDDTAIWIYQVIGGEIRVLEHHASNFKDVAFYCSQLLGRTVELDNIHNKLVVRKGKSIAGLEHRKEYHYKAIHLPHDAKHKTLAAMNKSTEEQFAAVFGWNKVRIVPNLSIEDGRKAVRQMFPRVYFSKSIESQDDLHNGIECLRQHQREWDDDKKCFRDKARADWTIHTADAFRYLGVVWQEDKPKEKNVPIRFPVQGSFDEMREMVRKRRAGIEY